MKKRRSLLFWGAIYFAILTLFYSCRKLDIVSSTNGSQQKVQKFLNLPIDASPQIKRIAAKLKVLEETHGLVSTIADKDGFARWDKTLTTPGITISKKVAARSANATDTLVFIPLVLENAQEVNAFIFARLNDSVSLRLYRANDYASYGFGTLQDSFTNAEKLAVQFMLLDFETFGHSNFKVLDDSLLTPASLPAGTLTKDTRVHIEHRNNSTQARGNGWEVWEYDVCTSSRYLQCSSNTNCCTAAGVSPGACASCEGCWKTITTCKTTTILVAVDDGWFPSDGSGNGGIGSGNGGTYQCRGCQCNPTPLIDNGFPPCPKGNTTGWEYAEEPVKDGPCDIIKGIINNSANTSYMQKVKDLANTQNLNLNFEKSVALVDAATPIIKEEIGTANNASVQVPDIPGQKYLSLAHTHPNILGGTYSVFSFGDLKRMSMLMHAGQLDPDKFVAFLSTYKGTNYAITINDMAKFEDFFYFYNNSGTASSGNILKWMESLNKSNEIEKKYFQDKNGPLITETDTNNSNVLEKFLDFMNEADLGVTMLETNASFSAFTIVEKQQDGTIKRTNCN